jgi:hypothetical protein
MRSREIVFEAAPPSRRRRTPPAEQTDEPPGLVEREQVEIEREIPAEDNQAIDRIEPRELASTILKGLHASHFFYDRT